MVWGCFVKNRLGPLVILDGKVTGQVYRNLLQDEIPYLFQDDNAPVHQAATTMHWACLGLFRKKVKGSLKIGTSL